MINPGLGQQKLLATTENFGYKVPFSSETPSRFPETFAKRDEGIIRPLFIVVLCP